MQKIKALHERRQQGVSAWPNIFDSNQDTCTHLKAGGTRNLSSYKDYAISLHTFADGHSRVKCLICGKEWEPDSPEALKMLGSTTNTRTSSEVCVEVFSVKNGTQFDLAKIGSEYLGNG